MLAEFIANSTCCRHNHNNKEAAENIIYLLETAVKASVSSPMPEEVGVFYDSEIIWSERFEVEEPDFGDSDRESCSSSSSSGDTPCYRYTRRRINYYDFWDSIPYIAKVITVDGPFKMKKVRNDVGEWGYDYDGDGEMEDYFPKKDVTLVLPKNV